MTLWVEECLGPDFTAIVLPQVLLMQSCRPYVPIDIWVNGSGHLWPPINMVGILGKPGREERIIILASGLNLDIKVIRSP